MLLVQQNVLCGVNDVFYLLCKTVSGRVFVVQCILNYTSELDTQGESKLIIHKHIEVEAGRVANIRYPLSFYY